jgi:hypothetical protein
MEFLCAFELIVLIWLFMGIQSYKEELACEIYRKELYQKKMFEAFDQRDRYIKAAKDSGIYLCTKVEDNKKTLMDAVKKARGGDAPIESVGFA